MSVLRFIFITILVLWIIRLLIRLILPNIIRKHFRGYANTQPPHKPDEGTISILSTPKKEKQGNVDKLGDFIEYEEVK